MKMTGLIMAGGKSSRMGEDKALLQINSQTFIQRILEVFQSVFEEVIILSNNPEIYKDSQVQVVPDLIKDKGPLGGLYTGLMKAKHHHCVIAACDMPFINLQVTSYLAGLRGYQAVVPYVKENYHPLFAAYARDCLPIIEKQIVKEKLKMVDFIKKIDTKILYEKELLPLDPKLSCFININTREEYKQFM
jgi:molybdopterin-guanine dinucleotide biosynthesis protein A